MAKQLDHKKVNCDKEYCTMVIYFAISISNISSDSSSLVVTVALW